MSPSTSVGVGLSLVTSAGPAMGVLNSSYTSFSIWSAIYTTRLLSGLILKLNTSPKATSVALILTTEELGPLIGTLNSS